MYRLSVMRCVRGAIAAAAGFATFMASAVDINANTTWTSADAASHASDDIVIAGGVTLTVNLAASETATLGGVISGAGALKLTGNGGLVLSGANTFSGGFTLQNTATTAYTYTGAFVSAANASAFGTGKVTMDSFLGKAWLDAEGTFANAFEFRQVGHLAFARTLAGKTTKLSGAVTASCDVIVGGGSLDKGVGGTLETTATGTFDVGAEHDVLIAIFGGSTAVKLYGKVTARALRSSSNNSPDYYNYNQLGWTSGTLYLCNENDVDLFSAVGTAFSFESGSSVAERTEMTDSYLRPDPSYRGGSTYYLDADLTVGSIPVYRIDACPAITPTVTWGLWRGNNGKERTLTVVGGGTYVSQAQFEDYNNGKLTFHWNPQGDDADGSKLILSNRAHTTSGKFIVSKGEVAVCGAQASLRKLSALEVKAGAKFTLETDVADPLAGLKAVSVASSSAVTLPEGTALEVASLTLDGEPSVGTFTPTNCNWLKGTDVSLTCKTIVLTKSGYDALAGDTVTVPANATLVVETDKSAVFAFEKMIVGAGAVEVTGDGEVDFSGANAFTGGFTMSGTKDCIVVAKTDTALGQGGTITVASTGRLEFACDGAIGNPISVTAKGYIWFTPNTASQALLLNGPVTATSDFFLFIHKSNAFVRFKGSVSADGRTVNLDGGDAISFMSGGNYYFDAPVAAALVRGAAYMGGLGDNGWSRDTVRFTASGNRIGRIAAASGGIHFAAAGCLDDDVILDYCYGRSGDYRVAGTFFLDGCSLAVGAVTNYGLTAIGKSCFKTAAICSGTSSGSLVPATLTVNGTSDQTTLVMFQDAVSLDWNPSDDLTLRVIKNESSTVGAIIVSKGQVRIEDGASFPNLTAIKVKDGARFVLDTSVASALKSVRSIVLGKDATLEIASGADPFANGQAVVEIATGGKIDLGEGLVAKFGAVRLDGVMLEDKDYTSATWLTGSGTVKVDSSVLSATLWKNAANGDWATAANWTKGVPASGLEAQVTAGGKSYEVSVSQDAGAIGPLTVGNAAAGQTATVAVSAPLTLSPVANSLVVGRGGCVEVGAGGSVGLPCGSLSSDTVSVSVQDGGVLSVAGGEMTLTNYTGQVNAGHGGKITVSSGILRLRPGSDGRALTVNEGGAIEATGGQLLFSSYGWNGDGLAICNGAKLDVSGDAVVGPLDGMTYTRVFGDGEMTFRGHSTFGRSATGGVGGWGYCFATGSGAPTGTVNFIEYARFYDTSSSLKIDRGAGLVAQVVLGSEANHTFNWKTYAGAGAGGRGELIVTNGVLSQGGIGMSLGGAYEKQGATAALTSDGFLRVVDKGTVHFYNSNEATGDFRGLIVGDGSIATTNKTTGLGYDDTMRGYVELAEGGVIDTGNAATIIVGVGNPNVFGRLIQTGGTLTDNSISEFGPAAVGMGGGTGEWLMSGGTATLKCNLYVGGALLADDFHRTAPPSNSGRLYVGERDYPKQAKGLLKLTGGAMSLRRDLILSKDGEGVLELGPAANLKVEGALNALAGSKLVVDITGYAGRSRTIATFGSVTRWFDTVELKGETEGYAVLVDPAKGRVSVKHLVGSVLMVR